MRRATPIRDEDIFDVALERFWDAPGGNDAGVRAVVEFCRGVFLDKADDAMREAISDFMVEHVFVPGKSAYDLTTFVLKLRQENLEALFELVRGKMPAILDAYDQGRRDVLNAILALNPKVAQKLHVLSGGTEDTFENHAGKLPFDVVFWTT